MWPQVSLWAWQEAHTVPCMPLCVPRVLIRLGPGTLTGLTALVLLVFLASDSSATRVAMGRVQLRPCSLWPVVLPGGANYTLNWEP